MRTFWRRAQQSVYVPVIDTIEDTIRAFTASGRALFLFFAGLLVLSSVGLLYLLNEELMVAVPAHGGALTEGIVGAPRFINPILATSDADHDLVALVYSGLLRATPDGKYINDLAERYTISQDGRTYTVTLKNKLTFHDGTPLTVDDILFTVGLAQNAALKSPERANWDGVAVDKVDERTVTFTLKAPYAPFIENLTLGILPKHLWQKVRDDEFTLSDLNTAPVGSGPFKVSGNTRTTAGIPASYALDAFDAYALGTPYLDTLTLRFFQNETALVTGIKSGSVEAASGVSPSDLTGIDTDTIRQSSLNRIFGIFFNQNQAEVLRDPNVRKALDMAIEREALVTHVLAGFGTPLTGPVPPTLLPSIGAATQDQILSSTDDRTVKARALLAHAGWTPGQDGILQKSISSGKGTKTIRLSFTLATGNVPELRAAAEYARSAWRALGVDMTVEVYDQGDLAQNVIRPRKYDALLFGEIIGRELDLFAFWDSSQRIDPGLNIALYANSTADRLLQQLRETSSPQTRATLYTQFASELTKDTPAVFLYTPDFVYIVPKDVLGLDLGFVETPSDRFLSAYLWHRETDHVWPLFAH